MSLKAGYFWISGADTGRDGVRMKREGKVAALSI